MRDRVHHIGAIGVDPHGLAGRHGNAGTCSGLDEDAIRAVVLDDVRLLDGRHHEVASRATGSPGAAQAQVARCLASIRVGERQRDVVAGERNVNRADDRFFDSRAQIGVGNTAPRGVVLTRGHQLDFQGAVGARHLTSLRIWARPSAYLRFDFTDQTAATMVATAPARATAVSLSM